MVSIKDQIYISSLTREVYDTERDRAENQELASSSNRNIGGVIMPKIAAECLAKWVTRQDIAQHELETGKTTVWTSKQRCESVIVFGK